jgi:uncharacterized protein
MKATNPRPVALITGGSSGIGFELAKVFAENNYSVIIVAEDKKKLKQAAERIQRVSTGEVGIITADLSKADGPDKVFKAVQQLDMEINVLVNNAGVGVFGEFGEETDLNDELSMIQLNVVSVVHLTKLFLPLMLKRGYGKILITASIASITSAPMLTVYAGTKAFDYIFAEGLRDEVKEKGITVTALLPGATDTNFFKRAGAEKTDVAQDKEALADPADVAKVAYDALMSGKDHVIAGFKNKMTAAMADIMPKEMTVHNSRLKKVSTK